VDSFRSSLPNVTTLPGYFKQHGYYTTSVGKVFHCCPELPPRFDFPQSWSDEPIFPRKPFCGTVTEEGGDMSCALPPGALDADQQAADVTIQRLTAFAQGMRRAREPRRFFAAVGFQGPRLPWIYPQAVADRYPPPS